MGDAERKRDARHEETNALLDDLDEILRDDLDEPLSSDFPSRDSLRSSGTPGATTQRAARTPRQLRANKQ
jgi:hypothetical protein